MSVGETPITVVGNLTDEPELKFTPSGAAMAKFTVASTPRTYDKNTGQWQDGVGMFLRCTAWRELADHAAETLTKGMRVIVTGRLRQHNWKNDQGENRAMLAVEVDEIGPSLRFATAKVTKTQRPGSAAPSAADDPWHTSRPAPAGVTSGYSGGGEEPPF
ncbi:single-stranded DNA-binding protein [Streptacidiphilus rugosus]|uniref:single-stranded DNA-binding protein n=1 Tax=Streptacidiphilus rugosus TaxID=405783 RepID=UPI0005681093|nr:single-stranded DNA-binding protein [Streptacidiphilus rugosus]